MSGRDAEELECRLRDRGGLTACADPDWLGWPYRLLEVGGLVVTGVLVVLAGVGFAALRGRQVETSTERHRVLTA